MKEGAATLGDITSIITSILIAGFLFVAMPFVYARGLSDPELTIRFLFLSVLTGGLAIYLLYTRPNDKAVFKNKGLWAFAAWLIISGFSLFRSYDVAAAVYDWLRTVILLFFLLLSITLLRRRLLLREYLSLGAAAAVILFSIYGVIDVLPQVLRALANGKPVQIEYWFASTLGNKNAYASTLFMLIPFLVDGIIAFSDWRRYFCLASAIIALLTILVLQSVSVLFAVFIFGVIVLLLVSRYKLYPGWFKVRGKSSIVVLVSVAIILTAGIAVFSYSNNLQQVKYKVTSLARFFSEKGEHSKKAYGSFTERALLWQHSFRMVKDYPILGCGTSNWKILLPRYGQFGIEFMDAGTLKFEHPHNDYVLVLSENGILGLILYLLIFFFILKQALVNIRMAASNEDALRFIIIFAGVIGFMLLSLFEFPKERFYPPLLLMLLFALILSHRQEERETNNSSGEWLNKLAFGIGLVVSCIGTVFFTYRFLGELHLAEAQKHQQQQDWIGMKEEIAQAKSFAFQSDRLAVPLAWYEGFASFYGGNLTGAKVGFERAVKLNPYFVQGWNDLGTCYDQEQNTAEAIRCYTKALEISPSFTNSVLNLTAVYYNQGNLDKAFQIISSVPPRGRDDQFKHFLAVILRAKLNYALQSVGASEEVAQWLNKKYEKDYFLVQLYNQTKRNKKNIDSVFVKMAKAKQAPPKKEIKAKKPGTKKAVNKTGAKKPVKKH